jgi:hypothetical protein
MWLGGGVSEETGGERRGRTRVDCEVHLLHQASLDVVECRYG